MKNPINTYSALLAPLVACVATLFNLIAASPTSASGREGHGGRVWQCKQPDGTNTYEVLDYQLARDELGYTIDLDKIGRGSTDPVQIARAALLRLRNVDPLRAALYLAKLDTFMARTIEKEEEFITLSDVKRRLNKPANCELRQAIAQIRDESDGSVHFILSMPIWRELSPTPLVQAGLILHEIWLEDGINQGQPSADSAMKMNAVASSSVMGGFTLEPSGFQRVLMNADYGALITVGTATILLDPTQAKDRELSGNGNFLRASLDTALNRLTLGSKTYSLISEDPDQKSLLCVKIETIAYGSIYSPRKDNDRQYETIFPCLESASGRRFTQADKPTSILYANIFTRDDATYGGELKGLGWIGFQNNRGSFLIPAETGAVRASGLQVEKASAEKFRWIYTHMPRKTDVPAAMKLNGKLNPIGAGETIVATSGPRGEDLEIATLSANFHELAVTVSVAAGDGKGGGTRPAKNVDLRGPIYIRDKRVVGGYFNSYNKNLAVENPVTHTRREQRIYHGDFASLMYSEASETQSTAVIKSGLLVWDKQLQTPKLLVSIDRGDSSRPSGHGRDQARYEIQSCEITSDLCAPLKGVGARLLSYNQLKAVFAQLKNRPKRKSTDSKAIPGTELPTVTEKMIDVSSTNGEPNVFGFIAMFPLMWPQVWVPAIIESPVTLTNLLYNRFTAKDRALNLFVSGGYVATEDLTHIEVVDLLRAAITQ